MNDQADSDTTARAGASGDGGARPGGGAPALRPDGVDDDLVISFGRSEPLRTTWDDVHRWAVLLAGLPVAVIATDAMGTVLVWSAHATALYGWTAEEAIGKPIQDLTVGPTDHEIAASIMASVTAGNVWEGEFTAVRRSGESVDIHVIDSPILGSAGEIIGIIGLSVDVSSQRDEIRGTLRRVRDASLRSLVEVDVERRRIAMELHDDLGQTLTALRSELHWLRERPTVEHADILARVDSLIADGIDSVHRVCEDLRPRLLHELGLEEAIRIMAGDAARRIGAEASVHVEQLPLLTTYAATALYRASQECLTNIERHAPSSTRVTCELREVPSTLVFDEPTIELIISSDSGTYHGQVGHGLSQMRNRLNAIGGSMTVESAIDGGVTVTVAMPTALAYAPEPVPGDLVVRRGHHWYLTEQQLHRDRNA